nr:hypothetical protein [FCB group bacterium]
MKVFSIYAIARRWIQYFFFILIFGTLQTVFTQAFGQWEKTIIDDDINLAVSIDVQDLDGDNNLDLIVTNALG